MATGEVGSRAAIARILTIAIVGMTLSACTSGRVPSLEPAVVSIEETAASDTGGNMLNGGQVVKTAKAEAAGPPGAIDGEQGGRDGGNRNGSDRP